jgi:hypothetical protein
MHEETRWMAMAEALSGRIKSLSLLAGVDVIVNRQKDLESMVMLALEKKRGAAVTVIWTGAQPVDSGPLAMESRYLVEVYGIPILRPRDVPADALLQAILPAVHNWHPDERAHCDDFFQVTGSAELLQGASPSSGPFQVFRFPLACRVTLPAPQFITP